MTTVKERRMITRNASLSVRRRGGGWENLERKTDALARKGSANFEPGHPTPGPAIFGQSQKHTRDLRFRSNQRREGNPGKVALLYL